MLKKLHILLLTVLAALCCTAIAWADYDYIDRYDVDVLPNTDDGSLTITVSLTWTALEELPYGQELKVGIPHGSIREKTALLYVHLSGPRLQEERDVYVLLPLGAGVYVRTGRQHGDLRLHPRMV